MIEKMKAKREELVGYAEQTVKRVNDLRLQAQKIQQEINGALSMLDQQQGAITVLDEMLAAEGITKPADPAK
jgi:hypothetical protein